MSNPAATIGLTYRGTDVQEASFGIFLELNRGLNEPARVRGTDLVIPGRAGRIAQARMKDARAIELVGIVTGAGVGLGIPAWISPGWVDPSIGGGIVAGSPADAAGELASYRAKAAALRALFDPTVTGALVATLEDSTTKTIQARTLNIVWSHALPILSLVSVELESVAPDWS